VCSSDLPNIFMDWCNEMDLMGLRRSGYIDEIEIKLSRSDFLADFKKTVRLDGCNELKHELLPLGQAKSNYFAFLMPEELAEKCEIPEYAGLYTCRVDKVGNVRVSEARTAPLLHKRKITENMKYQIGKKMAYRYWHAAL